ncbi:hypothetical protein GmHk_06G017372 [Glycine max]|nr:hypothetical protein GmHk_06G017372 [Glycine max]
MTRNRTHKEQPIFCEVSVGEAICNKPSGTWPGPCLISGICDRQCIQRENAIEDSASTETLNHHYIIHFVFQQ